MLVAGGSAALGAASGDAALGAAATGAAGDAAAAAGAAGNAARAVWIKKEPAESVLAYIARGKSLRAVMLNCGVECSEEALAMQLVVGSDECKATVSTLKMILTSRGCRPTFRTGRRSCSRETAAQRFSAEALERESLREAAEATPGEEPESRPRAAALRATTATRRATGRASSSTTNRGWSGSRGWRGCRDSRGGCPACEASQTRSAEALEGAAQAGAAGATVDGFDTWMDVMFG